MRRSFVTADVFTTTKGGGNPLAVVLDCADLTDAQMQMITREFNLSETAFVLPPKTPDQTAFVRIFTPTGELPFAGHPVVGTAVILANRHKTNSGTSPTRMVLEVPLGNVQIQVADNPGGAISATCVVPKLPVMKSPSPNVGQVAAALSLSTSDIDATRRPIQTWDAGFPVLFAALRSRDSVSRARVELSKWFSTDEFGWPVSVYPYAATGQGRFYARMFAPMDGVLEDAATGGAVAAFAGHLHACDELREGIHEAIIEQGVDMGRPSQIKLEIEIAQGRLESVRIGGTAVEFMAGSFDV